jgi:hypothetical protein
MRSSIVFAACGALVSSETDYRCGYVGSAGVYWYPDGHHECAGNHKGDSLGQKCWLRNGIDIATCIQDTDYDTHVKGSAKDYQKNDAKNCYPGVGANETYGHHAKFLSMGACKKKCDADPECEGITVQSPPTLHQNKHEKKIKRCWLKRNIKVSECHSGTSFDIYFHSPTSPGDFNNVTKGLNCYGGVGADPTYGAAELKYEDGSFVTHLGDCKTACHHDADVGGAGCEAVIVEEESKLLRRFAIGEVVGSGSALPLIQVVGLGLAVLAVVAATLVVVRAQRRSGAPSFDVAFAAAENTETEADSSYE